MHQPKRLLILSATQPSAMLAVESAQLVKAESGQPRRRYVKEIIRTGGYTHPKHGWKLDVTPERMDAWAKNFGAMRSAGVDVEVTVDHSQKAEAVRGYVTDMYRDGDRLIAVHEMIGDDAFKLAERVHNVSVEIDDDFLDSKGNRYGESIVRSSIVQSPIVPNQSPFERLAASRKAASSLALAGDVPLYEPAPHEAPEANTMKLILSAIEDITGAKDVTEATAVEVLKTFGEKLKAQPKPAPKLELSDAEVDAIDERVDVLRERIDGLVSAGKITPAVAKSLGPILLGEAGNRPTFLLSRRLSGTEQPIARTILDALAQNDPLVIGRAMLAGGKKLSNEAAGGEKFDGAAEGKRMAAMV